MDKLQARLEHVKNTAEERSQLQVSCLKELDLEGAESANDLGKLRFTYEKCIRENSANFPLVNQRLEMMKGNL